jgi:hypothetical protein
MVYPFDVFLSHSHIDAKQAELLARRLVDEASCRVWLDQWVLIPGESWQRAMAQGLNEARTCVVCVGEHTPKGWFQQEVERALNRQSTDASFRVIPVLLPNANRAYVDEFLELRTWVDFAHGLDDRNAFHRLVAGIRGVSPGREAAEMTQFGAELASPRQWLLQVRQLRSEGLIDDEIAQEYQRNILNRLIP